MSYAKRKHKMEYLLLGLQKLGRERSWSFSASNQIGSCHHLKSSSFGFSRCHKKGVYDVENEEKVKLGITVNHWDVLDFQGNCSNNAHEACILWTLEWLEEITMDSSLWILQGFSIALLFILYQININGSFLAYWVKTSSFFGASWGDFYHEEN